MDTEARKKAAAFIAACESRLFELTLAADETIESLESIATVNVQLFTIRAQLARDVGDTQEALSYDSQAQEWARERRQLAKAKQTDLLPKVLAKIEAMEQAAEELTTL